MIVQSERSAMLFYRSFLLLSASALIALVILCALGSWQVKRLFWKEALLQRIENQINQEPEELTSLLPIDPALRATENDPEYLPVTLKGHFLKGREFFYYATLNGKIGYHLYSPFQFQEEGNEKIVFINRGFIPDEKREPETRPETLIFDTTNLQGILRWPDEEKPNSFIPDNDEEQRLLFWRDLDLMIKLSDLEKSQVLPYFIYADKQGQGVLVGGVSRVDFPNNHLAYAITWYGLAMTLIGVWLALLINRLKT